MCRVRRGRVLPGGGIDDTARRDATWIASDPLFLALLPKREKGGTRCPTLAWGLREGWG